MKKEIALLGRVWKLVGFDWKEINLSENTGIRIIWKSGEEAEF